MEVDHDTAVKRLQSRNHFTPEECEKRISNQWSNEQREAFADVIIRNNGSYEDLVQKVKEALRSLVCNKHTTSSCTGACP